MSGVAAPSAVKAVEDPSKKIAASDNMEELL